jgi:4-hydroxybenzoate polyprenyltransferase
MSTTASNNSTNATSTTDASWLTTATLYMQMIRFSHTVFALPFALLATAWAYVVPLPQPVLDRGHSETRYLQFRVQDIIGILFCMVAARSFAMAVNRLLDERWDSENPRTANRHLPAKLIQRSGVIWFIVFCIIAFVSSCCLFLPNRLPLVLCLPVLAFLAGYTLAKRFTNLVHFWLGVALMLAPVCSWIALRGVALQSNPADLIPALSLGIVVLLWVSGFDIIYACQDAEYDKRAGLFSIPAKLGVRNALRVAAVCHGLMWCVALLMSLYLPSLSLGWLFRSALVIVGLLLIYEHRIVSETNLTRMQLAFFQLNSIISVLFLIVGTCDAYWR